MPSKLSSECNSLSVKNIKTTVVYKNIPSGYNKSKLSKAELCKLIGNVSKKSTKTLVKPKKTPIRKTTKATSQKSSKAELFKLIGNLSKKSTKTPVKPKKTPIKKTTKTTSQKKAAPKPKATPQKKAEPKPKAAPQKKAVPRPKVTPQKKEEPKPKPTSQAPKSKQSSKAPKAEHRPYTKPSISENVNYLFISKYLTRIPTPTDDFDNTTPLPASLVKYPYFYGQGGTARETVRLFILPNDYIVYVEQWTNDLVPTRYGDVFAGKERMYATPQRGDALIYNKLGFEYTGTVIVGTDQKVHDGELRMNKQRYAYNEEVYQDWIQS